MKFVIEPVTDTLAEAAAMRIREEVFEQERNIRMPSLPAGRDMLTLIARAESQLDPVAVLTVIDTTGDHDLHRSVGLLFHSGVRVARYTQLAVLKPFRGLRLPAQLILEGHAMFIAPRRIDYTWLLFDADSANSSLMCRQLGFTASAETYCTEYGCCRVLTRNERFAAAELRHNSMRRPLTAHASNGQSRFPGPYAFGVRKLLEDEWLAQ